MTVRIIRNGDLNKVKQTLKFECKACGCVFEADREDYKFEFSQRENTSWYEIKCPYCDNWCIKNASDRN